MDQFQDVLILGPSRIFETRTTKANGKFAAANPTKSLSSHNPNVAHQQNTVDAISNIASTTAHDSESVASLTATVAILTTNFAATNAKLIKALVETTKLTNTVGELHHTTPKPRGGSQH